MIRVTLYDYGDEDGAPAAHFYGVTYAAAEALARGAEPSVRAAMCDRERPVGGSSAESYFEVNGRYGWFIYQPPEDDEEAT